MNTTREDYILQLLQQHGAMDIEQLYYELSDQEGYTERVIKEAIQRLREQGKVKPNHQWRMEAV